ncbi:MAG TPA: glycosyltransferase family 4 protein [Lacibacter sp.]|nr:glycosyltransferase family 4 protein [Lacibacter sp.]HMO89274.1 glycosyltransferase family 4 protein [Lacibacter sp.]HMP86045.1 glycosyltransferase family 4 protein [Lacibacter sp.]
MPPPIHGAAQVGKFIHDSLYINQAFRCTYINLATSRSMEDLGKFSFLKIFFTLRVLSRILWELLTVRPELCYMTFATTGFAFYKDITIIALLRLFRKKVLFHFHHQGVRHQSERHAWKARVFRWALDHSNTNILLLSPHLYHDVAAIVKPEQVLYCANGIAETSTGTTKTTAAANKPVQLLFLSNMLRSKGMDILVEACSLLHKKGLSFFCHFVGDWKDTSASEFERLLQQKELSNHAKAYGKKTGAEKEAFYDRADIFVHPTLNDAFPLVLLEAMQHELPVVSTFEGAIPEIVADGESGFLVPKNDAAALAGKLEALMGDPALRKQMGKKGRALYEEKFTIHQFEQRFVTVIKQALVSPS